MYVCNTAQVHAHKTNIHSSLIEREREKKDEHMFESKRTRFRRYESISGFLDVMRILQCRKFIHE